ncbi:hypothetical protein P4K74_30505, partial [Bacillus cereus]
LHHSAHQALYIIEGNGYKKGYCINILKQFHYLKIYNSKPFRTLFGHSAINLIHSPKVVTQTHHNYQFRS